MSNNASAQREVLRQLFMNGPTWDGDISSKTARDELFELGLAERVNGWSYLTRAGMETAEAAGLFQRREKRDRLRRAFTNAAYKMVAAYAQYAGDFPGGQRWMNVHNAWRELSEAEAKYTDFHKAQS